MAAQQFRWASGAVAAKMVIDAGELGSLYYAETRWLRLLIPPQSGSHSLPTSGGGALLDLGVHALDQAMWLLGNPTQFGSARWRRDPSATDQTSLPITEVGIRRRSMWRDSRWRWFGSRGRDAAGEDRVGAINTDADDVGLSTRVLGATAGVVTDPPALHGVQDGRPITQTFDKPGGQNAWLAEIGHWVEVVKGHAEPLIAPQETLNVLRVLDAAYRSAAEGREATIHA